MVFEILTFDFYLEKKGNCIWMQAHHNKKMKELAYPPPNIVLCW